MTKTSLSLTAALSICLALPLVAEQPRVYGPEHTYASVADVTLTREQRRHYNEFKNRKAYFGAFYAAAEGDGSFYTYSYHNLNTAKAVAKRGCEAYAQGPCTFYGVAVPEGVDPNETFASGLGAITAHDLQGVYRDMQTTTGYGAFAISGAGDHGYSHDWPNMAEARATALAYCEAEVAEEMTNIRIEDRRWARANGLTTCRVIDTYTPPSQ